MVLKELFLSFLQIGAFSFGGGYAMIPLIYREIITRHHWLTPGELSDILAVSQMTPGPVAVNSATYVGFKMAGFWGSTVATLGVVLPSFLLMLLVSMLFAKVYREDKTERFFFGIRPVVVSLIISAALFLVPGSFGDLPSWLIFGLTLLALWRFRLDPILALLGAGLLGIVFYS